ncbi:hypothetical protein EDD86DRAFT_202124 [Gorgonomyces haynaldii]|nr:hypothetical protein EDD86DRAFT_202124 [Gorgonomyces haynaldii]
MSSRIGQIANHLLKESRAVVFSKHGPINKVTSVTRYPLEGLQPTQVLLKILAAPINPADVNIIEGTYPVKPRFHSFGAIGGNEGVAEIVGVGNQVQDLKLGDWVIPVAASFSTWQTYCIADADKILKLPEHDGVSPVFAATIAVNPPTAYRMLKDFGKLEKGDVVIQNSANSAVGQAVIQLAKAWGYKTVNIVRNRPTIDTLKEQLYSLGADLVITEDDVRKPAIAKEIAALGKAKLGLNGVGGKSATNLARLLADEAYLVTYGGMSKEPVTIPTSLYIFKRLTCCGFWLNKWSTERPREKTDVMLYEIMDLARQGKFKEPFHHTFSLSQDSEQTLVSAVADSFTASGKTIFVP